MKKIRLLSFVVLIFIILFILIKYEKNKPFWWRVGTRRLKLDKCIEVKSEKTWIYPDSDYLEGYKVFWVANNLERFNFLCTQFDVENPENIPTQNFDKYEYIFVYGYKLKYLRVKYYYDSYYFGRGYSSEYDMDESFNPNTIYIYEVKKSGVWDPEFM